MARMDEPPRTASYVDPVDILSRQESMAREHDAWLDLVDELRKRGVGDIEKGGKDYELWASIVKWGEELGLLRMFTPMGVNQRALEEKRELYPGRYEKESG